VLLVTDVADRFARAVDNHVGSDLRRAARFTGNHHTVGGGKRLAGDADVFGIETVFGAFAREQIHHFVGNPVTDLVRMAFGNTFAGEQIIFARHQPYLSAFKGGLFARTPL